MLLNYGRGRAEQFRLHPTPGSILNFVPPLFCLYLLALAGLAFTPLRRWALVPLGLYAIAVAGQTLCSAAAHGPIRAAAGRAAGGAHTRGLRNRLLARPVHLSLRVACPHRRRSPRSNTSRSEPIISRSA
jgi:hypothetical protein